MTTFFKIKWPHILITKYVISINEIWLLQYDFWNQCIVNKLSYPWVICVLVRKKFVQNLIVYLTSWVEPLSELNNFKESNLSFCELLMNMHVWVHAFASPITNIICKWACQSSNRSTHECAREQYFRFFLLFNIVLKITFIELKLELHIIEFNKLEFHIIEFLISQTMEVSTSRVRVWVRIT